MRFLKRILVAVLIYAAIYLPFVVIMQTVSGGDYTAAYAVGGASASVELILCALIKREEGKKKHGDDTESPAVGDSGNCADNGDRDIPADESAEQARGD